ncbi:MAG: hypothetical protein IKO72_04680 [Kiritimatiellae bacterium]|nr:hypothetical protein [Kiritimatiellia bacterium]
MNKNFLAVAMAAFAVVASAYTPEQWTTHKLERGVTYRLNPARLALMTNALNRATMLAMEQHEDSIVETWREGGRIYCVTNPITPVAGVPLVSTFAARLEQAVQGIRAERDEWHTAFTNSQVVVAIQTARAERAEARFNATTNRLHNAIDSAALPTTRLLLQGILDAILAAEAD